jgi:hypothetical protein
MGRLLNLLFLAAMIAGAGVTYDLKHKAELAADRVARLQDEIAKESDRITVLKAEWSMLTQPARLQELVGKYSDYFQLQPFSPQQVATIDQIPLRAPDAGDDASRTLARIAAGDGGKIR